MGQFYCIVCKDWFPVWQAKNMHWHSPTHLLKEATFALRDTLDLPRLRDLLSLSEQMHMADLEGTARGSLVPREVLQLTSRL